MSNNKCLSKVYCSIFLCVKQGIRCLSWQKSYSCWHYKQWPQFYLTQGFRSFAFFLLFCIQTNDNNECYCPWCAGVLVHVQSIWFFVPNLYTHMTKRVWMDMRLLELVDVSEMNSAIHVNRPSMLEHIYMVYMIFCH